MVECIASVSVEDAGSRDIIKALLGIIGHSAMSGSSEQFSTIPLGTTVLQLCAKIVAANFSEAYNPEQHIPWPEQQRINDLIDFITNLLEILGRYKFSPPRYSFWQT